MDKEKELMLEKKWKRKIRIDFKSYMAAMCNGKGVLNNQTLDYIVIFLMYDELLNIGKRNINDVKEYLKCDNVFVTFITWWASLIKGVFVEKVEKDKKEQK